MSHTDDYVKSILSDAQYEEYKAARRQDTQDSTARQKWRTLARLTRETQQYRATSRDLDRIATLETWLCERGYVNDRGEWTNKTHP